MISNARGKHSSPGVYMEEIDKTYATKSLGITTLGLVGETLKGPAFEPIRISDWNEFQDYFGGTSTEKYVGNKYPKYELPYIAKSYLQESKNLEVCRVLGLSGYDAGPAFILYSQPTNETSANKNIVAILRSKGSYNSSYVGGENTCVGDSNFDTLSFFVSNVKVSTSNILTNTFSNCSFDTDSNEIPATADTNNYGIFALDITSKTGNESVTVSLNPGDKNYIIDVLGMSTHSGSYSIYVEELYDLAHKNVCEELSSGSTLSFYIEKVFIEYGENTSSEERKIFREYQNIFTCAKTPWFVSEIKGNGTKMDVKRLFRFHTISDGNASNYQIKVSIENILPDEGLFDVVIRDFNDSDSSPIVLERFNKCSMKQGTTNYIGLKIGTFDGEYSNKSKYVTVEVIENETTENCVPCGFLGYPMRWKSNYNKLNMLYNKNINDVLKLNRQYFGMSDLCGVDVDVLSFKGSKLYKDNIETDYYTNGFHLDSHINTKRTFDDVKITVDGVENYKFETPVLETGKDLFDFGEKFQPPHIGTEDEMSYTIYSDKKLRKFTCYPYGGFDGWDIYRTERTNTDSFKVNKYKGTLGNGRPFNKEFNSEMFGLVGKSINSDYYAYLAGYRQFDNPSKTKINLLATPGIDYVNNLSLFNEVLDIVEESRQGDCLYIVTTPDKDKNGNEVDAESAVSNLDTQEVNTSYAATYYPWVKYYDETNKKYINLPVTKDVVRNFAYTDNIAHPWFASAGMSRGSVDCVKAAHFTKLEEEDVLYEGMINPVKSFGTDGVKIWGNKTMYKEDTPLNRINVRRLMIRIKDLVMSAAKQLIFEQNDNTVEAQFRSIVDPILANAKQNRGISDYKIKTDSSAEARDRKELPAAIHIKPINCLEYIPITFTIYPEGAKFED